VPLGPRRCRAIGRTFRARRHPSPPLATACSQRRRFEPARGASPCPGAARRQWQTFGSCPKADLDAGPAQRPYGSIDPQEIQGRTVRLVGIYIPPTWQTCQTSVRPVRCGSRAVLALEFKIRGFVKCEVWSRYADGSIDAVCRVRGQGSVLSPREDLGAWLIKQGWAVALPDAPFEYAVFEKIIARTHRRGIWGFQADSVR